MWYSSHQDYACTRLCVQRERRLAASAFAQRLSLTVTVVNHRAVTVARRLIKGQLSLLFNSKGQLSPNYHQSTHLSKLSPVNVLFSELSLISMPSRPFMTSLDKTRRQHRVDYRVWCRTFIFEAIDWNFILEHACSIRRDQSAKFINEARHQGTFYMDRHLQFDDGRIWVARVRTPGPNYLAGGEKMLEPEACLKSEIANATFLK